MREAVQTIVVRCIFPLLILLVWSCPPLARGDEGRILGTKMASPPSIDGVVDLAKEWAGIPGGTGLFDDQTGRPSPENMRFWLAYDETYVYFAAKMADSDPSSIRATEYRTNVSLRADDSVTIRLDPFGNYTDDNRFEINPRGATDMRIPGGRANKREWQGEFQAKARITEEGWECEARIPWSIMRLPPAGKRDLRVNVGRDLQRIQRNYTWRNTSGGNFTNAGYWTNVEVPAVEQENSLMALPYVTGGFGSDGSLLDAGVDLKTKLTPQLDAVASINPDFRNIENEILSIDFSYIERLAGESRPFFLEGQQYFSSMRDNSVFASQRIDKFDFGAKVFGKLDERTSVGVLDAVNFGESNAAVARVSHSLGARSNANITLSSLDTPGFSNQTGQFGFSLGQGPYSFYGNYLATADSVVGDGYRQSGGFFYRANGLTGSLSYTETSKDLLPRLGFVPETDYRGAEAFAQFERPYAKGPIREQELRVSYASQKRLDGTPFREGGSYSLGTTLRDGTDIGLRATLQEYNGFSDRLYSVDLERPKGNPYNQYRLRYTWGRIGGVDYLSFGPSFAWRPRPNLQILGSFQHVDRNGASSQTILAANYDLDESQAIAARMVVRDSDTGFYLAYRQSGNVGNEYYVILGDPNAPTFRARLTLKAVFPMSFGF